MEKNQALCYLLHLNNPVKYERDQTLFKNIVFWTSYNFSERKKLTQMCLICRCALYLQMCLICADVPYMCRCALNIVGNVCHHGLSVISSEPPIHYHTLKSFVWFENRLFLIAVSCTKVISFYLINTYGNCNLLELITF